MMVRSVEKNFLKFFEDEEINPLGIFCVCYEGGGCQFPTPRARLGGKLVSAETRFIN